MKQSNILSAALILAALTGCAKIGQPDQPDGLIPIQVSLPQSELKTMLGEKGATTENVYDILWKEGDCISINGIVSNPLSKEYEGTKSCTFFFPEALSGDMKILYPSQSESSDDIVVPATQTYTAGSFDPSAAPLYGYASEGVKTIPTLHNLTGTIMLPFKGSAKLDRIELTANNGEAVAGTMHLLSSKSGFSGSFEVKKNGSSTIVLSFGSGLQLTETAVPVFIPVLAQTYQTGFTAKVFDNTGKYHQLKFWGSSNTVSGDNIYEFPATAYNAGRADVIEQLESMTVEENTFDTKITVGTYNVWSSSMRKKYYDARNNPDDKDYYFTGDGVFVDNDPRLWDNSKSYVAKAIMDCGYDVFGIIEAYNDAMRSDMQDLVQKKGGNYTWKFFTVDSSNSSKLGIVYNPNIFEAIGNGGVRWLTDIDNGEKENQHGVSYTTNPTNYVKWEEGNARGFAYQFLKHKVTGRTIMFCVCHAPLNDDWNDYAGNHYVKQYVDKINGSTKYRVCRRPELLSQRNTNGIQQR